ncbi:MAG: hypothetical protein IPI81_11430 [Flavobacteriales bacterium]|nr:hypothetical protein [Flavobacteriales bacterium]
MNRSSEKNGRFTSEARRVETGIAGRRKRPNDGSLQELKCRRTALTAPKSIEKDEAEVRKLDGRPARHAGARERMARLENDMLKEIEKELEDWVNTYNTTAGYDYILSIQSGGRSGGQQGPGHHIATW